MRTIQYISPSSYNLWRKDKEQFYIRYLSDIRTIREPQTPPMAIGSAFDAYVKSYIFESLYGKDALKTDDGKRYILENMIENMVDEQNREQAIEDGRYVFEQYRNSGVLAGLINDMRNGSGGRMEFEIRGDVSGRVGKRIESVVLMGKPDLSFITDKGVHIILDFKVNGYYSSYNTSPMKGYIKLRSSGVDYGAHKDAILGYVDGVLINIGDTLDQLNQDWATQMSMYSWMCGEPVGSEDFIVAIHQIVCNRRNENTLPIIKVAEHRLKINSKYQIELFEDIIQMKKNIDSGHIFTYLSYEQNVEKMKVIDNIDYGRDPFLDELLG